MRRQLVDRVAPPVYAAIDFIAIIGPAVAIKAAADQGGMGGRSGLDLLITSTVLGAVHATFAYHRLQWEESRAVRRADIWIAAINALVVLAVGSTVLLVAILNAFAEEHAWMIHRNWPVWLLWLGVQSVALVLSEVTGRVVFWWLEPHEQKLRRRALRRNPSAADLPAT